MRCGAGFSFVEPLLQPIGGIAECMPCEAYIASQKHESWVCLPDPYDDGGFSGGTLERPGLQRLLEDIRNGKVDLILVYKVDRLSRSLLDFTKLVQLIEEHDVSFVSITQSFSTNTAMGKLTLNILLSFVEFGDVAI